MPSEAQALNCLQEHNRKPIEAVECCDYAAPAELFQCRMKSGKSRTTYKRFNTAAEAIRFAIEDVSPSALLGTYLEVGEARYGRPEIQNLYERASYPLMRRVIA